MILGWCVSVVEVNGVSGKVRMRGGVVVIELGTGGEW